MIFTGWGTPLELLRMEVVQCDYEGRTVPEALREEVISLWDIAAGRMLVEAAGGSVELVESPIDPAKLSICAWNGKLPLQGTLA